MKATIIREFGKPEVLRYEEVATPEPGPGDVLIKIEACGINRYDLYMRMGAVFTDIAFPHVLGADIVGTIAATGSGVSNLAKADRVICAPGYPIDTADWHTTPENIAPSFEVTGTHLWGGYAEYKTMPARFVLPDRTNFPAVDIASLPLCLMTAVHAVETLGEVRAGASVLVQSGASGSGGVCIQVAKALGARVASTVGGDKKKEAATSAGADLVIDYSSGRFADVVLEWTDGAGVDVIIDNVGASVFEENLRALKVGGIFVNFGLVGGMIGKLNFKELFFRQHQLRGSFMGSMDELKRGLEMVAQGQIKAMVDKTFALRDASAAHAYIESRAVRGKVVLIP